MIVTINTRQKFWAELRKIGFTRSGTEDIYWRKHATCYTKHCDRQRVMVGLNKSSLVNSGVMVIYDKKDESILEQQVFSEYQEGAGSIPFNHIIYTKVLGEARNIRLNFMEAMYGLVTEELMACESPKYGKIVVWNY